MYKSRIQLEILGAEYACSWKLFIERAVYKFKLIAVTIYNCSCVLVISLEFSWRDWGLRTSLKYGGKLFIERAV